MPPATREALHDDVSEVECEPYRGRWECEIESDGADELKSVYVDEWDFYRSDRVSSRGRDTSRARFRDEIGRGVGQCERKNVNGLITLGCAHEDSGFI